MTACGCSARPAERIHSTFDHAAGDYDATRGFPLAISDRVADAAAEMVGPGAQVLEIGIGTGRMAKPLLARGFRVTGIDLSREMMRRLLETLPPGASRPALVETDATRLPLASGGFDAVVSVHVFHLIAPWRQALAEARRSLKRDGLLLIGYDWRPPDSPAARILKKWQEIVRTREPGGDLPGARDFDDVTAALVEMGARMDERAVGEWTTTRALAQHIETIEHRAWSAAWNVPVNFFVECLTELREWAIREYGALEQAFTVSHKFIWQKFQWNEPNRDSSLRSE